MHKPLDRRHAANQKRYRDRKRNEIVVLRVPVDRETISDMIHAVGLIIPDPSKETLEARFLEFIRMFEDGAVLITKRRTAV
jgi:hypothetical protein